MSLDDKLKYTGKKLKFEAILMHCNIITSRLIGGCTVVYYRIQDVIMGVAKLDCFPLEQGAS